MAVPERNKDEAAIIPPADCNIFWAEHPNATAVGGCKGKIHAILGPAVWEGVQMDKEYRSPVNGGIDQPGDGKEAPAESCGPDHFTIAELARESGVTLRALRFYQSKGLLAPRRNGSRTFNHEDRDCLALILQGKRLGFTLSEIREMLAARARGCAERLPINRRKCVEQINMLERQRRDIDRALAELRQIYTEIFTSSDVRRPASGTT